MKRQYLFISLIFLFCFLIGFLFINTFQVKGAVSTEVYTHDQLLQPVQGDWFYDGRDCYEDFQQYFQGSVVNLTTTGTRTDGSLFGIYSVNSTEFNREFNVTEHGSGWGATPLLFYQNATDNNYVVWSTTTAVTSSVDLDLANDDEFTTGKAKFLFYYQYDMFHGAGNDFNFWFEFNGVKQCAIQFYANQPDEVTLRYFTGAVYNNVPGVSVIELLDWSHSTSNFHYMFFILELEYTFNQELFVTVKAPEFLQMGAPGVFCDRVSIPKYGTAGGQHYTDVSVEWRSLNQRYVLGSLIGYDSSRYNSFYDTSDIDSYVTKNLTAYNVEEFFSIALPPTNTSMVNPTISSIEIKSDNPIDDYVDFVTDVTGNTGVTDENLRLTTSYQTIGNVYHDNITLLTLNTKYRCKNLNQFDNTISIRIIRVYTPYEPTFAELIMVVVPSVVLLLVPSGIAYSKFKKTGFLLVFFVMSILLTVTGMIPVVMGILMIIVEILIFLKIMKSQNAGDE